MRNSKKAFMFLLMVCLMAVSIAMPATAAQAPEEVLEEVQEEVSTEVPDENYEVTASEILGEIMETLTLNRDGKNESEEALVNIVPKKATLFFSAKQDISAMVLGYKLKKGVLISEAIQWTASGSEQQSKELIYSTAGLTSTVTFSPDYSYYEVVVWDNKSNSSSYFFKQQEINGVDLLDDWAKPEVDQAIAVGLIPSGLQNKYKEKITRADFSKLIINYVEWYTELTIDEVIETEGLSLKDNAFIDTSSVEIIAANKLGIVNGKGNGKFDPNGSITRQEAAIMLTKTAEALNYEVKTKSIVYADSSSIAAWAKAGVDFVSFYSIMNGTGKNSFSPLGTYTRQQAYLTIARLSETLE